MRRAAKGNLVASVIAMGALAGCGTYTPDIQEFWATPGSVAIKVNAIAGQVDCELGQAVRTLIEKDKVTAQQSYPPQRPRLSFLDKWGAQATLTFVVDEKSNLTPGVSFINPLQNAKTDFPTGVLTTPQSFSLGLGGNLSTGATRTSTLSLFYTFRDLLNKHPVNRSCPPQSVDGILFAASDLKLREWLTAALLPPITATGSVEQKSASGVKNVISDKIKFQIVTAGNITPTWKLVKFSANTGNAPFFAATRDRTQELLITIGPVAGDPKTGSVSLARVAQDAHLAQEIGTAVTAGIQSLQRQ